jgi:hypothetical protein
MKLSYAKQTLKCDVEDYVESSKINGKYYEMEAVTQYSLFLQYLKESSEKETRVAREGAMQNIIGLVDPFTVLERIFRGEIHINMSVRY